MDERRISEKVATNTANITNLKEDFKEVKTNQEEIKESLLGALKVIDSKETRKIIINYLAAPFYRLEVTTKDYLDAENILSDALEIIEQKTVHYNGTFEFIRD